MQTLKAIVADLQLTSPMTLLQFQQFCFALACAEEGLFEKDTTQIQSVHEFCSSYVLARIIPELSSLHTLQGNVDYEKPVLPWYDMDDLQTLADEFLFCRRHLQEDELAKFVTLFLDKASFGRHHLHSYNALVQLYLPEMLRHQAPLVYAETPWSIHAAIDMLQADNPPLGFVELGRISETFYCMTTRQRRETREQYRDRLLYILRQQAQHWTRDYQHTSHQTHRVRFLGVCWGPATNVHDSNEGWPVPPHRVRLLDGALYSSAQYLRLEYEILNEQGACVHRQECYQQVSFFPVLVQSLLCHTSNMPRDVQQVVGEDPDERIPYLVLRGLCRIAISMEHRIVNHTLTFLPSISNALPSGNYLQTEAHTTREPDFEGSFNDAKVRFALEDNTSNIQVDSGVGDLAPSHVATLTGSTLVGRKKHLAKSIFEAHFRKLGDYLPVTVFFAAFGISTTQDMQELILQHFHDQALKEKAQDLLKETWLQVPFLCHTVLPVCQEALQQQCQSATQQAAWDYLYQHMEHHSTLYHGNRYAEVAHLLKTYYVHIGTISPLHPNQCLKVPQRWFRQAMFLAHQCASLLHVILQIDNPDKHEYGGNKRLCPTGRVLCREWRNLFRAQIETVLRKELQYAVAQHTRMNLESLHLDITSKLCKQLTNTMRERVGQTGSKNGKEDRNAQSSVVQNLDMSNHIATKSHVRRVDMPVERIGKCETMRDVQPSTWNKYCPVESPDSKAGGLVRNLSSDVRITIAQLGEWSLIRHLLAQDAVFPDKARRLFQTSEEWRTNRLPGIFVFLNGDPIGVTQCPSEFFALLKALKRSPCGFRDLTIVPITGRGCIGLPFLPTTTDTRFVSTFYESGDDVFVRHFFLYTDAGRIVSPYFVVDQLEQQLVFSKRDFQMMQKNPTMDNEYLVSTGRVEYLNTQEENCCGMLADFPHDMIPRRVLERINFQRRPTRKELFQYTHCQLHPAMMHGLLTNLIPYAHCSHAPRNQFATNMERQNCSHVSMYASEQFATYMRLLLPQHPLVRTLSGDVLRECDMGSGMMIHVLSLCFHGGNIEDGFPISKQFTERMSSHLVLNRSYLDEISSTQNVSVTFENPYKTDKAAPKEWPQARFNYDHVDADGLPGIGAFVDGTCERRSVVINKVCTYPDREEESETSTKKYNITNFRFRNIPEALRRDENGRVARVMRASLKGFQHEMAAVQVYNLHKLEAGDKVKFASGHKMTISFEFPPEDMPYCLDGSVVEGTLDPTYCFRMVCNQTAEGIANMATLCTGERYSAIAFSHTSVEKLNEILRSCGQSPMLQKCVCDGVTGEILSQPVPYFAVNMEALHYLAEFGKLERSRGPSSTFTHQAVEGRRRGGGIRFSDMDKENMMGHGATRFVHESTSVLGSNCHVPYCQTCHRQAVWPAGAPRPICRHCNSNTTTGFIEQQYAGVLFSHYQYAQGIQVLVETKKEESRGGQLVEK